MAGTTVYLTCNDVAETLTKLEKLGGKTLVPKTSIGEHGFIGHFVDTEGNKVGLHSVN
jgi:predicted enzyme related to lactoylglutathione lyase